MGLVFFVFFLPLDHTAFLPAYSPWVCHTDFIFPVPPLAPVSLCIGNLATEPICTMVKLVSHVIRTLGEGFQEEELQNDSEFRSPGRMPLDRGMARVDREEEQG